MVTTTPRATAALLLVVTIGVLGGCRGCGETERAAPDAGSSAAATTSTPTGSVAPSASSAAPALRLPTFEVVPADSKIQLRAGKATGGHDGGFKSFKATMRLNGNEIARSSLEITIDATSVFAEPDTLAEELKSDSLLEVKRYPSISFVSTKLDKSEKKGATHELTGNLTLHGVLKSITFPAKIELAADGQSLHIAAKLTIDRKDFGTTGKPGGPVQRKVAFKLDLRLARK